MSNKQRKDYRSLERVVKGFANHRRIEILELLLKKPELSVADISEELNVNFKTTSEHIRRLAIAGLVLKRYQGKCVCHKLTKQGENILTFLRMLE